MDLERAPIYWRMAKRINPDNSAKHLLKNLRGRLQKANALLATSHKGAWANGMTLIMDYETCTPPPKLIIFVLRREAEERPRMEA